MRAVPARGPILQTAATSDDSRSDEVLGRKIAEVIEEGLHQPLRATTVAAQRNMSERTSRFCLLSGPEIWRIDRIGLTEVR